MIRSAKVSIVNSNSTKLSNLNNFISEYRRVAQILVDFFWANGVKFGKFDFNINAQKFTFPTMLPIEALPKIETFLSGRAIKCISTQVCGIIRAESEKVRKYHFIKDKLILDNKEVPDWLINKINTTPAKPNCAGIFPELNSVCCDFKETPSGEFDGFFSLKSIINTRRGVKINIPVNFHRRLLKWKKAGKQLNSFLVSSTSITFRYEIELKKRATGIVVGADQGLKTTMTLSNGNITPQIDKHGHSLDSICEKLARKKKGSKKFKRCAQHRKNFIHWSINQLNLSDIREIRLEKIVNINFGRRVSRKMQAWTNTIIRDKMLRIGEEQEVLVTLQDSSYRSQRCSCCGNVRKANRNGKVYSCKHCGNIMDADLNAAKNHEVNLPPVPFTFRSQRFNLGNGFFWKPTGFTSFDGKALTVPSSPIKDNF